jgi:hypothetical protein
MTRFSQPSFLRGAPQPLVLSIDSQGQHPLELYEKIAASSRPSFLLESGKGHTSAPGYSFLGSGPVRPRSLFPDRRSEHPAKIRSSLSARRLASRD